MLQLTFQLVDLGLALLAVHDLGGHFLVEVWVVVVYSGRPHVCQLFDMVSLEFFSPGCELVFGTPNVDALNERDSDR